MEVGELAHRWLLGLRQRRCLIELRRLLPQVLLRHRLGHPGHARLHSMHGQAGMALVLVEVWL